MEITLPRRSQNESLFNLLAGFPWWISILFGAFFYLILKYGIGWYAGDHRILSGVAQGIAPSAPYFAALFLIPAILSLIKHLSRRELLNQNTSLDSIRALSWQAFEMLCGEAFRWQGYAVQENGLGGADGGVDLFIRKQGQTHLVQCKHWKQQKVGVKEVRELFGVVTAQRAASGILISTGHFTADARAFADDKPIDLINGPALVNLIGNLEIPEKTGSAAPKPRPQDVQPEPTAPSCPRCGQPTQLKSAKKGQYQGQQFWGCTQFPKCRGLVSLN